VEVSIENRDHFTVCHLSGQLDENSFAKLNAVLKPYLLAEKALLEIDFRDLEILNGAGVKAFMGIAYELYAAAGNFRFTGLKNNALWLIKMSGLQRLLGGDA